MAISLSVTSSHEQDGRAFRYEFDVDRTQILLGRRGGVDVLLPDASVSLVHARIERRGQRYAVIDDRSSSGTRINRQLLPAGGERLLLSGDRIDIGEWTIEVTLSADRLEGRNERAGALAQHMVREVMERLGPGDSLPSLEVLDGPQQGTLLTLDEAGRAYVLGRSGNSEIRLDDVDLWRERVGLMRLADGVEVRDLGAQPPVTVNERRLHGPQTLREGDRLQLGETTLRYRNPAEAYLRRFEEEFPESLGAIEPPPGAPRAESVEARAPSAPVARAAPPNLDGHGGAPRSLSASVRVSLESAPRPRRSWSALQRTFLAVACLVCSATVTLLLWILSG